MNDGPGHKMSPNNRTVLAALLPAVLVVAVYWQAGSFSFVNLDDPSYVTENPRVMRGLTSEGAAWAFATFETGNWHPLTWLSHMADVEMFGLDAGRHHLVNVLLHLLNTVLLFLALKGMTGAVWPSAFAAALFAAHPLHVESVAWVSERKDVLSAFFWILGMGGYARYVRRPGTGRYLGVAACMTLGLLAKPMVVTFPFALLLLDWWPLRRFGEGPLTVKTAWPLVREKIPLLALAAASSAVTYVAQAGGGAMMTIDYISPALRLSNAAVSYGWYLLKTFWPSDLAAFYPHPASLGESPAAWAAVGSALILAGITYLALNFGRRWPFLPAGWLWFLGTLVPVIGLVQVGTQAMADRYTYLPLIGIFLIVSWGIPAAFSGWRWRFREAALGVLGAAAIIGLAVAARANAGYWNDSVTLFSRALKVTDRNWLAWSNLGSAYHLTGRRAEAVDCYLKALALNRDLPLAWYNLGVAYEETGRLAEALDCFGEALYLTPGYAPAWAGMGLVHNRLGQTSEAITYLREAVRLRPGFAEGWNYLGDAYLQAGRFPEAVDSYREALRLSPGDTTPLANLGFAYTRSGQKEKAAEVYGQLLQIDPSRARQFAAKAGIGK